MEVLGDEALVGLGDAESFILLYRAYVGPVYRYLYAQLGDRERAEDALAQVFKQAWIDLPRYEPTGSFRGWLFHIAYRTLADYYPKPELRLFPVEASAHVLPDPISESEELRQALKVVGSLEGGQQDVISLRFMAELSYSEIASIVGKSESEVKAVAYHALEEIRRRYGDVC